jgi:hypothetical protein
MYIHPQYESLYGGLSQNSGTIVNSETGIQFLQWCPIVLIGCCTEYHHHLTLD